MKQNKQSIFSYINNKINSMSKIAILFTIVIYTAVLSMLVIVTEPRPDYISVPSYEHVYFDEKVNPQISIIANRTFDEDGEMTLKYNISVNIHGRISADSNSDPAYSVTNFKMSASLVENLGETKTDKMYYFTEQNR